MLSKNAHWQQPMRNRGIIWYSAQKDCSEVWRPPKRKSFSMGRSLPILGGRLTLANILLSIFPSTGFLLKMHSFCCEFFIANIGKFARKKSHKPMDIDIHGDEGEDDFETGDANSERELSNFLGRGASSLIYRIPFHVSQWKFESLKIFYHDIQDHSAGLLTKLR